MTKKPFRTLFKPISMNVHQQFFMEILSRHQWEALYLWPFTNLVYLLEQEQETIDPETYVKELVVTNPIILSALRTTIRQETKRQYNKNISHTYTNKIFPLATKTELRQGGRKQSVLTLIKLIHSVEKYYDDHNGERKESRTNTIKEDPKKWTWQLYQELNQAIMHPSAVHQKLFYQNYSNLDTRQTFKKNQQDFHVDQQDVIKKLEILLLPAIEKTRQTHEATQIKRSSKLKGNLRGNFQSVGQVEPVSLSQIKNLIQRTSVLKKESVERQRVLRSKFIHNRMIRTLLNDPQNQKQLKGFGAMDTTKWDETSYLGKLENKLRKNIKNIETEKQEEVVATSTKKKLTNTLKKGNLIYRESLQKDSLQTQKNAMKDRHIGKIYEETVGNSVLENRLKGIVKGISVPRKNLSKKLTRLSGQERILNKSGRTPEHLIYRESLQKTGVVTVEYPVLENRIKEIIKRVSVEREHLSRNQIQEIKNQTRITRSQTQLNTQENVLTKSTESQLTNVFEKQLNEHNVNKTVNRLILQRRSAQNLIYRESLQKAVLETRQDIVKTPKDVAKIREDAVTSREDGVKSQEDAVKSKSQEDPVKTNADRVKAHDQSQIQTVESPVLENRIKDIIKRVSVKNEHLRRSQPSVTRKQTHVTRNQTQLYTLENVLTKSTENQLTNGFEKQLMNNLGVKTVNRLILQRRSTQNLIYRESLQKALLETWQDMINTPKDVAKIREDAVKLREDAVKSQEDPVKTKADRVQAHEQSQLQTVESPVLENRIKDIIKRVSVEREHLSRNQTHVTKKQIHITRSQTQLNTQEKVLTKSAETQLTNVIEKQLLNNLELKTATFLNLQRRSTQNLIYRESLQKAVLETRQDIVQTSKDSVKIREDAVKSQEDPVKTKADRVQAHDQSQLQTVESPVLENRIKDIIKRVSVEREHLSRSQPSVARKQTHVTRSQTQLNTQENVLTKSTENQLTNVIEKQLLNNLELKTATFLNLQRRSTQNLIYRESLQKAVLETREDAVKTNEDIVKTNEDIVQAHAQSQLKIMKYPVLENRIKEIIKRVSVETQRINRYGAEVTNDFEVETRNNLELKIANRFNLQRRSTQKQTKQQVNLDNKIKEIMKRVSLDTQWINGLQKKETISFEEKQTNRFMGKATKSLKEKYYQSIPEMIYQLTESQVETNHFLNEVEIAQLKGSSLKASKVIKTLNTLKTLVQSKSFVQFNKAFDKTYSQTQTKKDVSVLDEKEVEAIEALKTRLFEVKEMEKAEQQHDRLLITSSRNLVLKNRQESELRHLKEDEGSKILRNRALKTVLKETQKTVLNETQKLVLNKTSEVLETEKRNWQHRKYTTKTTLVKQQDFHPLVQAVSKTIDKTWIKEIIRETSLLKTEHQEMEGMSSSSMGTSGNRTAAYANGLKNETLIQQQQELQQQTAGRRDTFSSEAHSEFEIDAQKLDLIADQVFRRVTDKFERERKRRGM